MPSHLSKAGALTLSLAISVAMSDLAIARSGDAGSFDLGPVVGRPSADRPLPPADFETPDNAPPLRQEQSQNPSRGNFFPATRIRIDKVILSGNTVFPPAELAAMARPYVGRLVAYDELEQLRYDLSRHYVEAGYINSGAVIPDQKIERGEVRIQLVEGRLSEIRTDEGAWLRPAYVRRRLERYGHAPLNIKSLQTGLSILQQDPLIQRLHAELKRGLRPGESNLNVRLEEARLFELGVGYDNRRSPSIGAERFQTWGTVHNLTGWGDAIGLRYGLTDGLDDLGLFYALPLTRYDTRLSLRYNRSDALVVEAPFDRIGINSQTETYGVDIAQPLYRTARERISATLSFDRRTSLTRVFDEHPFAFSEGVQSTGPNEGQSAVAVMRFALDGQVQSQTQAFAVRSQFSFGLNALGATINERGPDGHFANCFSQLVCPDGRFFNWLGQAQWARRLPWLDAELLVRGDVSLSDRPLLPLEKFSVGGATSVRGYRENHLVRDNGWDGSVELRIPLTRLPLPILADKPTDGLIQLAPFFDAGGGWNADGSLPPETIYSVGAGLRWDPTSWIHAELYWGKRLTATENLHQNLQDQGIHFQVLSRLY